MFVKSIILASVSAFAFAGAAAADIAWSGSASATYNIDDGTIADTVSLSAAASVAGDWTVTTTVDALGDATQAIKVSATDGTSTLTFGENHAAGASGLSTTKTAEVSLSTVVGVASVAASWGDNTELGLSMDAGGATVSAGFVMETGDYKLGLDTAVGDATVAFTAKSVSDVTSWSATLGVAVAGADLTFTTDGDAYTADVSYGLGDLTLTGGISDVSGYYHVGAAYDMGDISVSFSNVAGSSTASDNGWDVGVTYTAGDLSASISMAEDSDANIEIVYAMGAATLTAGIFDNDNYAVVGYDLGNGAALELSYASDAVTGRDADETSDDIAAGSFIGISFDF